MTNRPSTIDPFLHLIRLLRPRATLWGAIQATGQWGIGFRERHDLLFFRVDCGSCLLLQSNQEALSLAPGAFLLIRTTAPFTLASDREAKPVDSETLVAATRSNTMRIGAGEAKPVFIRGGRFVFDTASEDLLIQLLPSLKHVAAGDVTSTRTRALLAMIETENEKLKPGSAFVIGRLMELLLVEILRGEAVSPSLPKAGMLRGLGDPVIARALTALHCGIAKPWTTASLAKLSGSSRSAFNLRFTSTVGDAPMRYLHRWRMAIAKDELRRGGRSIAEIAFLIGFQSGGAFTRAFTRAVGCSPSSFGKTWAVTSTASRCLRLTEPPS